jgi:hypothetical protein
MLDCVSGQQARCTATFVPKMYESHFLQTVGDQNFVHGPSVRAMRKFNESELLHVSGIVHVMAYQRDSSRVMTSQVESSNTAVVGSSIDKLEYFTQWSQSRGIQISGVAPALLPGRGLGLVAIEDLKQGQRIVLVPNKAMLRPVMSASGTSKPDMHKEISRQAQLAMTLMAECRKVDSPLRLWEATWPSRVDLAACMPIQWEPSLQRLLPPATQDLLKDQIEEYGRDLNAAAQLCGQGFDNPEFLYYWCIVSTRGFHFKPVGNSPAYTIMCPFLDFANHGPSGSGIKVEQTRNGYEAVLDRDYGKCVILLFLSFLFARSVLRCYLQCNHHFLRSMHSSDHVSAIMVGGSCYMTFAHKVR